MEKGVLFAVCDDDEIICDAICDKIQNIFSKCGFEVEFDKFVSSTALFNSIKGGKEYDVLFLDIDMPQANGIELAQAIRKKGKAVDIIFVSNLENRVFDTFAIRPFGFVRKNNFSRDLNDTLLLYIKYKLKANNYLAVKQNGSASIVKLRISNIVYIESFKYKQTIYMSDGEQIGVRMSMEELEEKLREYDIVRTHKGYLVNLKYVQRIEKNALTLKYENGLSLSVSRDRVQQVKQLYMEYLRRMGILLCDE